MQSCVEDDQMIAQCESAYNQSESNIAVTSVTLQWEDANSATQFNVEYGISGFLLGTGTVINVNQNALALSGLSANTAYDYYIETVCTSSNISLITTVRSFTTLPELVVPEFRPTLSELNLFQGNLEDLNPSIYSFIYDLNTRLYTDYTKKQRIIALPAGTTMNYVDDGFPEYPDNTLIAKTFYYNVDDRDESLGKNIIETRVLIKINGDWELGNYKWNDAQTEAYLDTEGATLAISWIDNAGETNNVDYVIPTSENCFTCHNNNNRITPIGPRLRSMNFNIEGENQLQSFINNGHLGNITDISGITSLPHWENSLEINENRVRAYFDMNCAHCHSPGGHHNLNYYEAMDLRYETSFDDSNIFDKRYSIMSRIQTSVEGYSMPFLGVSTPHQEAIDLIVPYLESLE